MKRFFNRSTERRFPDDLYFKYLYLDDADIWFRSFLSAPENPALLGRLEILYKELCRYVERVRRLLRIFVLLFSIALLVRFDVVQAVSSNGVEISKGSFGIAFLPLLALLNAAYSIEDSRRYALSSVFVKAFRRSPSHERGALLLRFPEAFPFGLFLVAKTVAPKFLHGSISIREIFLFISVVLGSLLAVGITLYLILYFSIQSWGHKGFFNWKNVIILISNVVMMATLSFPTNWYIKQRYQHWGQMHLRQRYMDKKQNLRLSHYINKIADTHEGMFEKAEN